MPDKSGEEIRKNIKHFEESLPETERKPDAQEDTQRLIERAAPYSFEEISSLRLSYSCFEMSPLSRKS